MCRTLAKDSFSAEESRRCVRLTSCSSIYIQKNNWPYNRKDLSYCLANSQVIRIGLIGFVTIMIIVNIKPPYGSLLFPYG